MNFLSKLKNAGTFYRKADTYRNIENNELSDLIYKILDDKEHSCSYNNIEQVRKKLLKDEKVLNIIDPGAGSNKIKSNLRTVKSIAKTSLSPKWQCELMSNIIKEFHYETILELGTSLGISAAYLANANRHGTVYTLEGSEPIAQIAMQTFARLNIKNVKLLLGNFDITLPTILDNINNVDFAFIDGNHRYESTLKYFEMILEKTHPESIFIIDDIYWSQGMTNAWNEIQNHPKVNASLDFYYFGIVLFDKRYSGHHKVISKKYKF